MLVVDPDYLPDLEVFYFHPCLNPMKYLHPRSMYTLPREGVQRGGTPSARSGGAIPPAGCNDPKPLCKDHHCFGVFLKLFLSEVFHQTLC
jgi:hypothetical protein